MNPAKLSAQVVGAIAVIRPGHAEANDFATALQNTAHALDLGRPSSELKPPRTDPSARDETIDVQSPGELSDRILRALFGQWPNR
jgi:hypothetical protein